MGSESMNEEVKAVEAKNVLGPATPEEVGEHEYKYNNRFSPTPKHSYNNNGEIELETPKETLFDSFAPASDNFLLAPRHPKYRKESRNSVVRRLDFTTDATATTTTTWGDDDDDDDDDDLEEMRLFEMVYRTIMDAILAEAPGTPTSAPLLTGVAETCPPPPIKPPRKHRCCTYKEICRKLDFS